MSPRTWRIVTPEAVALELEAAGLASRVIAALIDLMAFWVVLWALSTVVGVLGGAVVGNLGGNGSVVLAVFAVISFFVLLLGWPIAWEVATKGRSLGKIALGLRVVTLEGGPIRFRHAAVRGLLGLVELYISAGSVALLVAMASRRFRRLGDHLAGTVVVRDRSGTHAAVAIRFLPLPSWEEFAHGLDVSRLTSDHHRLVRSYLLRAHGLDQETRWRVGHQILDAMVTANALSPTQRESLGPYDPVLPLTALAAAYQRRFSPDPVQYPVAPNYPTYPPQPIRA